MPIPSAPIPIPSALIPVPSTPPAGDHRGGAQRVLRGDGGGRGRHAGGEAGPGRVEAQWGRVADGLLRQGLRRVGEAIGPGVVPFS
eukprot:3929952-Pyramimonas_sp.AAC.2